MVGRYGRNEDSCYVSKPGSWEPIKSRLCGKPPRLDCYECWPTASCLLEILFTLCISQWCIWVKFAQAMDMEFEIEGLRKQLSQKTVELINTRKEVLWRHCRMFSCSFWMDWHLMWIVDCIWVVKLLLSNSSRFYDGSQLWNMDIIDILSTTFYIEEESLFIIYGIFF